MTLQPSPNDSVAAKSINDLPLTRRHLAAVFICALGLFWDVVEINIGNVFSAVFSVKTSFVPPQQLSWLLAAPYLGGIFGAPALGLLADRFGRRITILIALSVLAASSLTAAFSPDVRWLTGFRLLSGLAIAGYPPLVVAYLTDLMPARSRGKMIMFASAWSFLGVPAVIFTARWLAQFPSIGIDGWRWICGGAALGVAMSALLSTSLLESPRWLLARKRLTSARTALEAFETSVPLHRRPFKARGLVIEIAPNTSMGPGAARSAGSEDVPLVLSLRFRILGLVIFFLSPWSTVGFGLLSGAILVAKGFSVRDSLLFMGISACGVTVGMLCLSQIIDRFARRTGLVVCALLMGAAEIAFALSATPMWIILLGLIFMLCASAYAALLNIYAAEMFPSGGRAFAASSGWAVNRLASVLVPLVLLPLLKSAGPLIMCSTMACTLIASVGLLSVAPQGRAGKLVN